jgi:hypothetical protein
MEYATERYESSKYSSSKRHRGLIILTSQVHHAKDRTLMSAKADKHFLNIRNRPTGWLSAIVQFFKINEKSFFTITLNG